MSINSQLAEFLSADERPEGTMNYPELYGYLFVIACSPIRHEVEDWYPLIFNDHDPNFASEVEAFKIKESILLIHSVLFSHVHEGSIELPEWGKPLDPPMSNFELESPLSYWARGVIEGHDWLAEVWKAYLSPKLDGEISACLMVLSFFSDKNLAQAYCDEYAHVFSHSIEDMAETVVDTLEHAMVGYARVGKTVFDQLDKLSPDRGNMGSDSLCPCGSGKPFTACCLH